VPTLPSRYIILDPASGIRHGKRLMFIRVMQKCVAASILAGDGGWKRHFRWERPSAFRGGFFFYFLI